MIGAEELDPHDMASIPLRVQDQKVLCHGSCGSLRRILSNLVRNTDWQLDTKRVDKKGSRVERFVLVESVAKKGRE